MNLKIGDKINYVFFKNLTIIDEDELHYILQDKYGNKQNIFKSLINKYAEKLKEEI